MSPGSTGKTCSCCTDEQTPPGRSCYPQEAPECPRTKFRALRKSHGEPLVTASYILNAWLIANWLNCWTCYSSQLRLMPVMLACVSFSWKEKKGRYLDDVSCTNPNENQTSWDSPQKQEARTLTMSVHKMWTFQPPSLTFLLPFLTLAAAIRPFATKSETRGCSVQTNAD